MVRATICAVFVVIGVVKIQIPITKNDFIAAAYPSWERLERQSMNDGTWRIEIPHRDGMNQEMMIRRRGRDVLVEDRRQRLGENITLVSNVSGDPFTVMKGFDATTWALKATDEKDSLDRYFMAYFPQSAPWTISGAPLREIFNSPKTEIQQIATVGDSEDLVEVTFSMKDSTMSIYGTSGLPFVYYPASCVAVFDKQRDWRMVEAHYTRPTKAGNETLHDELNVVYVDDGFTLRLRSAVGSRPLANAPWHEYRVTFDAANIPGKAEFALGYYGISLTDARPWHRNMGQYFLLGGIVLLLLVLGTKLINRRGQR